MEASAYSAMSFFSLREWELSRHPLSFCIFGKNQKLSSAMNVDSIEIQYDKDGRTRSIDKLWIHEPADDLPIRLVTQQRYLWGRLSKRQFIVFIVLLISMLLFAISFAVSYLIILPIMVCVSPLYLDSSYRV